MTQRVILFVLNLDILFILVVRVDSFFTNEAKTEAVRLNFPSLYHFNHPFRGQHYFGSTVSEPWACTVCFKDHRQRIPRFVIRRYLEKSIQKKLLLPFTIITNKDYFPRKKRL